MTSSFTELTALLNLVDQVRSKPESGGAEHTAALNLIGQAFVDFVALKEQERADELAEKPKEEAESAAKLAAMQSVSPALDRMGARLAEVLAQAVAARPEPVGAAASAHVWNELQVDVNTDRMGRMTSFTIKKVA